MSLVEHKLVIRESKSNKGKWECVAVYLFSDGSVTRTVLCERDTEAEAMKVIERLD